MKEAASYLHDGPRPRILFLSSFSLKVLARCDVPFGRRVTRQLAMQAEQKMHLSYLPPSIHPHPTHTGQSMACDSLSGRAIDWVMQLRTYTVCRALDTLRSKQT